MIFQDYFPYLIPVIILLGAFLISYLLVHILEKLSKIASRTKITLDDKIIKSIENPARLTIILIGFYFAIRYIKPDLTFLGFSINNGFIVIAILLGAYTISKITKTSLEWYAKEIAYKTKGKLDDKLLPLLRKTSTIIIYTMAFLVIFDKLGIEIGPMLAGLGIAGLAVALALQDTLSNLFSALYITADRPIKVGDFIQLENGEKGYVEDISWRSTKIKTLPNNLVILPNAKLAQSIITNYSSPQSQMSLIIPIGVSYSSDLDKVEKICIQAAKNIQNKMDEVVKDVEPLVRFNEFADSSINFSVILRVKSFVDQYLVKHEFMKELSKTFKKNKIEIPFPQRDVHIKK